MGFNRIVQLTGKLTPLVLIGDKGELLSLSEFLPQILPFISSVSFSWLFISSLGGLLFYGNMDLILTALH